MYDATKPSSKLTSFVAISAHEVLKTRIHPSYSVIKPADVGKVWIQYLRFSKALNWAFRFWFLSLLRTHGAL